MEILSGVVRHNEFRLFGGSESVFLGSCSLGDNLGSLEARLHGLLTTCQ